MGKLPPKNQPSRWDTDNFTVLGAGPRQGVVFFLPPSQNWYYHYRWYDLLLSVSTSTEYGVLVCYMLCYTAMLYCCYAAIILYTIVKQSSSQNTTDCHYLAHRLLAPVTDSSTGLVPLQLADRYLRILLILILVRSLTCHHHSLQLVKQCAWNLAQLGMNGVLWPSLRMWML